MARHR